MRVGSLILCLAIVGCQAPATTKTVTATEPAAKPDHVIVALQRFEESQKADLNTIRKNTEDALSELKVLANSQPVAAPDPRTADISEKLDDVLKVLDSLVAKPPKLDPPPAEPPAPTVKAAAPPKMTQEQFKAAMSDLKAEADRIAKETAALKATMAPQERAVTVNGETLLLGPFLAQWYRGNSGFHAPQGKALSFHLQEHGVSAADVATMDYDTQRRLHIALHERDARGGRSMSRGATTYSAPMTTYAAPVRTYTTWVKQCVNGVCSMVPRVVQYQEPQRQETYQVKTRTKTRGSSKPSGW